MKFRGGLPEKTNVSRIGLKTICLAKDLTNSLNLTSWRGTKPSDFVKVWTNVSREGKSKLSKLNMHHQVDCRVPRNDGRGGLLVRSHLISSRFDVRVSRKKKHA